MVVFIPVFILLVFAVLLQILGRARFNLAQAWIFTLVGAFLAWFSYIFLKVASIGHWQASYLGLKGAPDYLISFAIDDKNWVFGFLLLSLLIAVLLVDAGRFSGKNNLIAWTGALVVCASGLLASLSSSLIAFLANSVLLDAVILFSLLSTQRKEEPAKTALIDFSQRVLGLLLIFLGLGIDGEPRPFLLITGLVLRTGSVVPAEDVRAPLPIRQNLLALMLLAVPISTMAFMARVDTPVAAFSGRQVLLVLACLLALARLIRFLNDKKAAQHPQVWVDFFSGLAVIPFVLGRPDVLVPLAVVVVVLGSLRALIEEPIAGLKLTLMVLEMAFIGLPYTPSNGLWLSALQPAAGQWPLVYDLLLLAGLLFVLHSFFPTKKTASHSDQWVKLFFGASPMFLVVIPWFLIIWVKPQNSSILSLVWPGITLVLYLLFLFVTPLLKKVQSRSVLLKLQKSFGGIVIFTGKILSFDWLIRLVRDIYWLIFNIVNMIARIIEGEGGLLWAFVFLILISTILISSRG